MSGQFNDVWFRIYQKAVFIHCASHRLNIVLSTNFVINCLGVMNDTINLFRGNV